MGFVAAFLLFSFAAIVEGDYDDPPKPKISETFSTWFTYTKAMMNRDHTTVLVMADEGYIARDMQGGRQMMKGTVEYATDSYTYSWLYLVKQNASYHTTWDSNNKRTCYMHHGTVMPPLWDWINYANYFGRGFNVDTWVYKDHLHNETTYIDVPANDPTFPLDVETYCEVCAIDYRTIYNGFNAMYQPVDSDFEIPSNCQSVDKGPLPFQHVFNHHKERKTAPCHGNKKNFPNKRLLRKKMTF